VCEGDIFHAVKAILDTCKKSHPAFGAFARALGDAFLVPVQEDLAMVDARLKEEGMSRSDIDFEQRAHWRARYLRHARRTTGTSKVKQFSRVKSVIDFFEPVVDPLHDNEPLLRPGTMEKVSAINMKIAKGEYLDPFDVDMFKALSPDAHGMPRWQNCRGTNALEGLHHHLNSLLGKHRSSPQLAYHVVMNFISRWNIDRAREYRGRDDGFTCYYDQARMERIMMHCRDLQLPAPFKMLATFDFQDTGETFGIPRGGMERDSVGFVPDAGMDAMDLTMQSLGADDHLDGDVRLSLPELGLVKSEQWAANRACELIPLKYFSVDRPDEISKFEELFNSHRGRGEHGGADYDGLAWKWELLVQAEEKRLLAQQAKGTVDGTVIPRLYRKSAQDLKTFQEGKVKRKCVKQFFQQHADGLARLNQQLRRVFAEDAPSTGASGLDVAPALTNADGNFHTVTSIPALPMLSADVQRNSHASPLRPTRTSSSPRSDSPRQDPSPRRFSARVDQDVGDLKLRLRLPAAVARPGRITELALVEEPRPTYDVEKTVRALARKQNAPARCHTCGHFKFIGAFSAQHERETANCRVAVELRSGSLKCDLCTCIECAPITAELRKKLGEGAEFTLPNKRRKTTFAADTGTAIGATDHPHAFFGDEGASMNSGQVDGSPPVAPQSLEDRNAEIRELKRQGWKGTDLAQKFKLNTSRISRIINQNAQQRQL
jgi:hypothetical protein